MPKMKTHSGASKRFRKIAGGTNIKRSKAYRSHHAWAKTTKQKRGLRKVAYFFSGDFKKIRRLLPK